jgi:hypothetical protein
MKLKYKSTTKNILFTIDIFVYIFDQSMISFIYNRELHTITVGLNGDFLCYKKAEQDVPQMRDDSVALVP